MTDSKLKQGANIKQTSTTTGTGTLTLASVATFNTFLSEIGEGNQCYYRILDGNGSAEERGIGTIVGSTLIRNAIASTNNNNLISLSSNTHIVLNEPIPDYASLGMDYHDLLVQSPELRDYSETVDTPSIVSGVLTLNLERANVFSVAHNQNITSLVVTNPPASGKAGSFTLHLTQGATGGRTITFNPAIFGYGSTTAPTIPTTANKRNKFVFDTINGGAKWDIGYCGLF